jgi:HD-GYP domain-containing protein (c-di-GMP phosphodiesterase class II)
MNLDSYDNPDAEALLVAGQDRTQARAVGRERATEWVAGLGFLVAATALALLADWPRQLSLPTLLVVALSYLALSRVQFVVSDGFTLPTQLIFVPMLFVLPTPLVPLTVAAMALVTRLIKGAADSRSIRRAGLAFADSWYAMGPALVLVVTGTETFAWSHWPAYAAALLAQVAFDATAAIGRGWFAERIRPSVQARLLVWLYLVDAELSIVGLLTASAAVERPGLVLLCIPVAAMLALFARDRTERLEQAALLSSAYRGTALLLGDVVESDDAYTGSHSRHVVELAVEIADALDLDAMQRRRVEFAALLHDVGKVRISKEIINKAGPLDDAEWAIMRRHTIEGEAMLQQVGGALADVGRIVRASHEHFDGRGYPDGLAGADIPVEARIVTACDAYSAITTDRAYRQGRSPFLALQEMDRCAGTQFDPVVVRALRAIVGAAEDEARPSPNPARLNGARTTALA